MRLLDILMSDIPEAYAGRSETDALRAVGSMQEAQLLAVRIDQVRSSVWLLFDCRTALEIRTSNTAAIAMSGLRAYSWRGASLGPRTAWMVARWEPSWDDRGWSLRATLWPSGELTMLADRAAFYVGNVPGGDGPGPDIIRSSDEELNARLTRWSSEFVVVSATAIDATSSKA